MYNYSVYNFESFSLIECSDDTYGLECVNQCGHCSNGDSCNHVNGSCLNGCDAGFSGDTCDTGKEIINLNVNKVLFKNKYFEA